MSLKPVNRCAAAFQAEALPDCRPPRGSLMLRTLTRAAWPGSMRRRSAAVLSKAVVSERHADPGQPLRRMSTVIRLKSTGRHHEHGADDWSLCSGIILALIPGGFSHTGWLIDRRRRSRPSPSRRDAHAAAPVVGTALPPPGRPTGGRGSSISGAEAHRSNSADLQRTWWCLPVWALRPGVGRQQRALLAARASTSAD